MDEVGDQDHDYPDVDTDDFVDTDDGIDGRNVSNADESDCGNYFDADLVDDDNDSYLDDDEIIDSVVDDFVGGKSCVQNGFFRQQT